MKVRHKKGLRVVVFGSAIGGQLVLDSLIRFEQKYPDLLTIVGMVTDDPIDLKARISLKKRIWNNYSPGKSAELMNMIITTSLKAGIPCFTGKVKTDYFRKIFSSWNPEVLIMNCFGQKLDAFLYDYPSLGAFNFHPSNLACSIGIGAQPFQEIMHRGLDTSPIVIHKVTEIIDAGPVVGISPEINIRLPDGSYPLSIISLLMKMNSICGWMTIDLLLEILDWKSSKEKGTLTAIDFNKKIPDAIKLQLLEPVKTDLLEKYELPLHPKLT
ncbi:MAG: hypothetical protein WCK84_08440 [Bacteroidota bacterium]